MCSFLSVKVWALDMGRVDAIKDLQPTIPSSQGCAFSVLLLHTCMLEWVNGWVSFYILSLWLVCHAHGFHVCVYQVG